MGKKESDRERTEVVHGEKSAENSAQKSGCGSLQSGQKT